jgi:phosphate transport system protein
MTDKHLSTQFDAELSGISNRVLEMGGLVESQVAQAIYALTQLQCRDCATQVLRMEERVNQMEVEIDAICRPSSPAASPPRATCGC